MRPRLDMFENNSLCMKTKTIVLTFKFKLQTPSYVTVLSKQPIQKRKRTSTARL